MILGGIFAALGLVLTFVSLAMDGGIIPLGLTFIGVVLAVIGISVRFISAVERS